MFIKHLSIRKKIALAFSIVAIINLLFVFFLSNGLTNINSNLLNYTDDTLPAFEKVGGMSDQVSELRRAELVTYVIKGSDDMMSIINESKMISQNIEDDILSYGKTVWPGEEQASYDRLIKSWREYTAHMEKFNEAILQGDRELAYSILIVDSYPSFKVIAIEVDKLSAILKSAMDGNRNQILTSVNDVSQTSIFTNALIVIFMFAITWLLSKAICEPLTLIVKQADAIAQGDLSTQLNRDKIGNDELGVLADASLKMQDNLRQLIENTIAAVSQLGSAVDEMTQISDSSTQGLHEQQLQIAQIATAMAEMKASVAEVAHNTEESAVQANDANAQAANGAQDNRVIVNSIQEIASVIDDAGNTVSELEEQSYQINIVVDVIRGIAEQTNLLALNAAIEAARAGESGRGFAVVADEVRTLAGRTQNSTGEITSIIEKLQELAKKAKVATEKSCSCIETYSDQGERSLQLMNSIEHSVSNISDMGTQIASACSQQDSVAEELSRHIETIHIASQEVSEGSKQTALACSELRQLSFSLNESMKSFKLN